MKMYMKACLAVGCIGALAALVAILADKANPRLEAFSAQMLKIGYVNYKFSGTADAVVAEEVPQRYEEHNTNTLYSFMRDKDSTLRFMVDASPIDPTKPMLTQWPHQYRFYFQPGSQRGDGKDVLIVDCGVDLVPRSAGLSCSTREEHVFGIIAAIGVIGEPIDDNK